MPATPRTIHTVGVGSDFTVADHGTICILRGHTDECAAWIEEHVGNEETQRWGQGIVVEPRYIGAIVEGLVDAGFTGRAI